LWSGEYGRPGEGRFKKIAALHLGSLVRSNVLMLKFQPYFCDDALPLFSLPALTAVRTLRVDAAA